MDSRILLVEDDPSIREVTAMGLGSAGFSVTTAADGVDALERFRTEPYDLVLLDIMLPRLDGYEVCRQIRKTSTVPVVMLTARGDTMDVVVGLEAGADACDVRPPIRPDRCQPVGDVLAFGGLECAFGARPRERRVAVDVEIRLLHGLASLALRPMPM